MRHRHELRGAVICMAVLLLLLLVILITPADAAYGVTTQRQDDLHTAADILRSLGYADDSEVIQRIKAEWWQEDEDLSIIAKTIQNEADPAWCEWEHSVAVGAVVVNRKNSPRFPDTIKGVVAAPGQYLVSYTCDFSNVTELAYKAAKAALDGDHDVPDNAYWQDNRIQGVYVWKSFLLDTGWYRSTTYICCGIPGVE